ncbi:MAG: hypothetical protein OZ915_12045, partial [Ignavibacteriales bacterium]|nr:hypothetical protein [Ignavibacteriales bacterium]
MHQSNNFWSNLKLFADNVALIDTANKQTLTYKRLDDESDFISEKIKLSHKGLTFLFTTNNLESVVLYIALLKSGSAVLLLDEKLN